MITWINFLHLYQPPSQTEDIVDQLAHESYTLIINLLKKYPNLRLSMNISGSLLELLEKYEHQEIIDSLKKFAETGQIELVSTAMYHPLLPLISEAEVRRQIKLHDEISKKHFGDAYKPRGFYLPEMAYNQKVEAIIKEMGYEWIILDEIHAAKLIDPRVKYELPQTGMTAVFRNHEFSLAFPPEFILTHLSRVKDYIITAHDGELYGHWHKDDRGFYEKIFTSPEVRTSTVSEYITALSEKAETRPIQPREASWESMEKELEENIPFALWNHSANEIHKKLWELAKSAELILSKYQDDPHAAIAQRVLSKGLASCSWWWASGKKIGVFSPESWNPTDIEKGAQLLLNSIRSLVHLPSDERLRAEKMFSDLRNKIWETHWLVYYPKSLS